MCAVLCLRPVSVLSASVDNRTEGHEPRVLNVGVQGILLKAILEILVIVLFQLLTVLIV
jgi:hypothetical protein